MNDNFNRHKIELLIKKYEANRDYYRTDKYNETLLRSDFLDPLFEALGWDIKNSASRLMNEREVLLEEALKSGVAEHTKKPDYTFRLYADRKFFLEAKKPSVDIINNSEPAKQVRRYGFTAGLKISVLSNFENLVIYDTTIPVAYDDQPTKALIKKFHYSEYAARFEEINLLLGREAVYGGHFDEEWKALSDKIDVTPVDLMFLHQINEWRLLLGTEILDIEPDIDITTLNDSVQSYINKILFFRVCEDRNIEEYQTLLAIAEHGQFCELIEKFSAADKKYNSGLFEVTAADRVISADSKAFWTIIRQLYYPECPYSFSVLSSDILGRIYELFLSEKLAKTDKGIALVRKPENVGKDIVTTPVFIIRELLAETVKKRCEKKSIAEIKAMNFADIACGSGAFLLELYGLLCDLAVDYCVCHEPTALIQTNIDTYKLKFEYKKDLLLACVYGVDKDFNAVEATKFGLLLKLLEDEDVNSILTSHPILPNLDRNIFYGNSLLEYNQIQEQDTEEINPFDFGEMRFDVVIGNPPYMKTEDMKNLTPTELPLYKKYYHSAYKQFDKYFLFIERGFSLLKNDGQLAFIVPNKFMKVGAGKKLREMIVSNKSLRLISSFGANLVFSDKSTYTCLIVLDKQPQEDFHYTEINDLRGWIAKQQNASSTDTKLLDMLSADTWALYPDRLDSIYRRIVGKSLLLSDLVGESNIFNGIQTSANKIYVFQPTGEDKTYVYFTKSGKQMKVEKMYTRPFFKTLPRLDALSTYHSFEANARVIYPYCRRGAKVDVVPLAKLEKDAPCLYNYLMENKKALSSSKRDIKPVPATPDEWHRYGRQQSLDAFGMSKIVVGVLSKGNKYAYDTQGVFVASGGTAGYCAIVIPEGCLYSPYYIQAILNSKYIEWVASLYGEINRGGYIARGTKVLMNLPVKSIDFENAAERELHDTIANQQKRLIKLGDNVKAARGDKRQLITAERNFARALQVQEETLRVLYGLSEEQDKQVPLISRQYAAD